MSTKERRLTPRKGCVIPIRFIILTREYSSVEVNIVAPKRLSARMSSVRVAADKSEIFEGEAVDLSERGISFKSAYKLEVGKSVELFSLCQWN